MEGWMIGLMELSSGGGEKKMKIGMNKTEVLRPLHDVERKQKRSERDERISIAYHQTTNGAAGPASRSPTQNLEIL
jgi:hypothetical protein